MDRNTIKQQHGITLLEPSISITRTLILSHKLMGPNWVMMTHLVRQPRRDYVDNCGYVLNVYKTTHTNCQVISHLGAVREVWDIKNSW